MADDLEVKQQELERIGGSFATRIKELESLPLGLMAAAVAKELGNDATRYQRAVHSVFDVVVSAAYVAWKRATELRGKFLKPGDVAILASKEVLKRWELARLQREEATAEARKVLQAEAAPGVPVAKTVDLDAGKLDGISTTKKYRGTILDKRQFLHFIADAEPLHYLIDVPDKPFTDYLTASGGIPLPGVEVKLDLVITNRLPKDE